MSSSRDDESGMICVGACAHFILPALLIVILCTARCEAADQPAAPPAVTLSALPGPALMPPWFVWDPPQDPNNAPDVVKLDEYIAAFLAEPTRETYLPLARLHKCPDITLAQKRRIGKASSTVSRNMAVKDAQDVDGLIKQYEAAPDNAMLFRFRNLLTNDTVEDLISAEDEGKIVRAWLKDGKLPPAQTPPDVIVKMEDLLVQLTGKYRGPAAREDTLAANVHLTPLREVQKMKAPQRLMELVRRMDVSPDDARKIVSALWENTLIIRPGYLVNAQPFIEETHPTATLGTSRKLAAYVDGTEVPLIPQDGFGWREISLLDWRPEKPGQYQLTIEHAGWGDAQGTWAPVYRLRWQVKATLNVVEAAPPLELVSDPQLDQAMRACFRAGGEGTIHAEGWVYHYNGLSYSNLPVPFAYRVVFRDNEGKRSVLKDYDVANPAGAQWGTGHVSVPLNKLGIAREGAYSGTIILDTNREKAAEDPALQKTWQGTIELPMAFEVKRENKAKVR